MSHLLNRFSLHTAQWNSFVPLALCVIWIAVLGCIVSSVLSQPFDRRQRFFWIAMVVLLPGIGVLSYIPFAFRKEDLPQMFQRKSKRARAKERKASRADSDA